jgi:hypothetical protein
MFFNFRIEGVVHDTSIPGGTRLDKGDSIRNCLNDRLEMQGDGNLVLWRLVHNSFCADFLNKQRLVYHRLGAIL